MSNEAKAKSNLCLCFAITANASPDCVKNEVSGSLLQDTCRFGHTRQLKQWRARRFSSWSGATGFTHWLTQQYIFAFRFERCPFAAAREKSPGIVGVGKHTYQLPLAPGAALEVTEALCRPT